MKIFIVYAHPEPQSFNGLMKDQAVGMLSRAGHEVRVSDLYARNFTAVASPNDFRPPSPAKQFRYQDEQLQAHKKGTFAPDIRGEQENLIWCDTLILQFPLWWFTMPAILKGWVDRVLATGFAYDSNGKWYNEGHLKGRRAMLAITTGGTSSFFTAKGINGDINQTLHPIHYGILYFVGFAVLPPFVAYGPSRADKITRAAYIEQYKQRLLALETTEPLAYPVLADYNEKYELKIDAKV